MLFCPDVFDQLVGFTKTIIPLALMAAELIAHSKPIRARGIIVKYIQRCGVSLF